jgi:hypothetical protein
MTKAVHLLLHQILIGEFILICSSEDNILRDIESGLQSEQIAPNTQNGLNEPFSLQSMQNSTCDLFGRQVSARYVMFGTLISLLLFGFKGILLFMMLFLVSKMYKTFTQSQDGGSLWLVFYASFVHLLLIVPQQQPNSNTPTALPSTSSNQQKPHERTRGIRTISGTLISN